MDSGNSSQSVCLNIDTHCRFNINMAGRNSMPSSSRAGSRRESFDSSQTESLSTNGEFMKLLRRLPDELTRLESEIRKLKREANTSHSR